MEPASTSTPLPQTSNSDDVPVLPPKHENPTALTSLSSSSSSSTTTPSLDTDVKHIRLSAISQSGDSLQFKVRMTTPLQKVIDAYCSRMSISEEHVRFLYDGVRVDGKGTAESHGMEDEDILDVVLQQTGGFCDQTHVY